jgi:hypothetical protein
MRSGSDNGVSTRAISKGPDQTLVRHVHWPSSSQAVIDYPRPNDHFFQAVPCSFYLFKREAFAVGCWRPGRLARSGVALDAVVSMHGSLATVKPAEPGAVMAKVLVCHGALDPHVPMTDVVALTGEMTRAGANWQVNVYGGAVHGFTHARAVEGATPGVAYHAETDRRSFAAARDFLAEALAVR